VFFSAARAALGFVDEREERARSSFFFFFFFELFCFRKPRR